MVNFKRLTVYLLTFLVVSVVVILLVNFRDFDHYLVGQANKNNGKDEIVNKELVFVQLDNHPTATSECQSFTLYRQSIIKLLNTIAEQTRVNNGPKGVVLDFWISSDITEMVGLEAALQQLKTLHVPVYASYNVNAAHESVDLSSIDFNEIEARHATDVYDYDLAGPDTGSLGRCHTLFYAEQTMASYENSIALTAADGTVTEIPSLPFRVAHDLNDSKTLGREVQRRGAIIPYGSISEMQKRTYTFIADSVLQTGTFLPPAGDSSAIDMDKKIIVAGDAKNDVIDIGNGNMPGPYLVTWALSDLLDNFDRLFLPIENLYLIIGQMIAFSLLSVFVYALLFKYVKALQTSPSVIGILSFIAGLLCLYIYYRLMLNFKAVIPAGQTIAAIAVACILSWRFAHKFLVTGVAEGSEKYDVFISYSRAQGEWVMKNVYEPLAALRKPNGDKLNIFFDVKSIGIGEAFTAKYMWAIVDAKCFIPVISEDYYKKNHCKNELDCAIKRWVEKLISIEAIAFSFSAVPEAYNSINFVDITKNPNFMEAITAQLLK
ncbi:MAG TPA: toll/interleukin-1 receptor domain-containing protein [Panacibacter sp.]|nr:toll/interleukin-1 receptor domain-containing protein [Panacibacter sp.]HNP45797.1 toll/interleukin-1 receptor domain-containing protein [Panacibacter sp.]